MEEKRKREYYDVARDLLDYLDFCAERRFVPLKHDLNVFRCRLNRAKCINERNFK